ncbi:anion exchange protein [Trichuris trichiura]|uniref:Anion exchange protein n=1 Tax=Trichuris trichiura TaxID=36087 RepID=A0A077YZE6_TRITR|nr:anion exchange protein [Trichuris trichiura]
MLLLGLLAEKPVDQVRFLLDSVAPEVSNAIEEPRDADWAPIFCELLELHEQTDNKGFIWREKARWVKYEETVGISGERWSKPHISLLAYQSIMTLRKLLADGLLLTDCEPRDFAELVGKDQFSDRSCKTEYVSVKPRLGNLVDGFIRRQYIEYAMADQLEHLLLSPKHYMKESLERLKKVLSFTIKDKKKSSDKSIASTPSSETPLSDLKISVAQSFKRKLQERTVVAVILVGCTDLVKAMGSAFVRLRADQAIPALSQINLPIRYVFLLLAPKDCTVDLASVGRCLASILIDSASSKCLTDSITGKQLSNVVDDFITRSRIIPPNKIPEDMYLEVSKIDSQDAVADDLQKATPEETSHFNLEGLLYTGRLFGGLFDDVKRILPRYLSDITDAFTSFSSSSQITAATLFLFLTNLANIIIFGAVMSHSLDNQMGIMECIISGCVSGVLFGLLSGQPLNILSATGPVLIFESIFYRVCESHGIDFLAARGWLCMWTAVIIILLVAFDTSFLVAFITRFTEELFATLIAVIFVVEAIQGMANIYKEHPIVTDPQMLFDEPPCHCVTNSSNSSSMFLWDNFTAKDCELDGGTVHGLRCHFYPDIFLFSLLLFLLAYLIMYSLKKFRTSAFFPDKVRETLANFAPLFSIVIATVVSELVGLKVPKLILPSTFRPSIDRPWIVNWLNIKAWWIYVVTFFPALLLTILLVMDQQITAVIVNRPENLLKKGFGYHLDLLVVSILTIICGVFGLPIFVAATMLSISHIESLKVVSECKAPGEKPAFIGIREQRVSALAAHLLIGLSLLLTPVLQMIPLPALLGVFLHMGLSCLFEQQLLVMVVIRKLLDRVFSRLDLQALDDLLPLWNQLKGCKAKR